MKYISAHKEGAAIALQKVLSRKHVSSKYAYLFIYIAVSELNHQRPPALITKRTRLKAALQRKVHVWFPAQLKVHGKKQRPHEELISASSLIGSGWSDAARCPFPSLEHTWARCWLSTCRCQTHTDGQMLSLKTGDDWK